MAKVLKLNENETIQLYDLASECHKDKKVPADIEEFIINNKDNENKNTTSNGIKTKEDNLF